MYILCTVLCLISLFLKVVKAQEQSLPANNQVCLIVPPEVEECYRGFFGKPIEDKAAQVNCLQKLLWNFTPDLNNTQVEIEYFRSLAGDIGAFAASNVLRNGSPRPPSGRRARQEYRTLAHTERQRFHDALNKLYEDGTIRAFARLHARAFTAHHGGASFLPWHRVFLVMFEEALRRIDPTVSLPFWDSTIDNDMDNPVNSVLWTPEYFGNGIGDVSSGPAAGWVTDQGNLERNYGQASRLLSKDQIRRVLSRCELQQISQPAAETAFDLELCNGGPHVWVGGDMAFSATTAFDPVFYMHMAFVDYIWELFRRRQYRLCGIDPTVDYPSVPAGNSHAPESLMVGFEWLTNADGLKHYWIDNWYYYESTPACPNCCRGCRFPAPIYCDRRRRVCTARSRRNFAFGPRGPGISQAFLQASLDPSEVETINAPVPPRNRRVIFQHPPSDGRTIHTAISDAFAFAIQEEKATREPPGQSGRPDVDVRSDDPRALRGSGRSSPLVSTSRRSPIQDSWGAPPPQSERRGIAESAVGPRASSEESVGFQNGGRGPPPEPLRVAMVDGSRSDFVVDSASGALPETARRGFLLDTSRSALRDSGRDSFSPEAGRDRILDSGRGSIPDSARNGFPQKAGLGTLLDSGRNAFSETGRGGFVPDTGRDAILDSSRNAFNTDVRRGQVLDNQATIAGNSRGGRRGAVSAENTRGKFVDPGPVTSSMPNAGDVGREPPVGGRHTPLSPDLPLEGRLADIRVSLPGERQRTSVVDMSGVKLIGSPVRGRGRKFDSPP